MPSEDDPDDVSRSDSIQPAINVHPPAVPMHMFPLSDDVSSPLRAKRRQVKKACTNCQKACKKCDDGRPCKRCITYGAADECVDTQRKERKKGVRRGPYKKREGRSRAAADSGEQPDTNAPQGPPYPGSANMPVSASGPFMPPIAFPPGFPPGFPFIPSQVPRPGEGTAYCYIPIPVMAAPTSSTGQDGEGNPSYSHPAFYSGPYFNPYAPPHAYVMHSQRGPDGQPPLQPHFGYGPVYMAPPQGGEHGGGEALDHENRDDQDH